MRNLCLTIAALMLAGCATSTPPLTPPTKPLLDASLAQPCPEISKPDAADYDLWLLWSMDLLEKYGLCAGKHAKTVQAWPK